MGEYTRVSNEEDFFEDPGVDPLRDYANRREIPFKGTSKNKVYLTKHDPYGFWFLTLGHGPIANEFTGAYLSAQEATVAAETYIAAQEAHSNKPRKFRHRKTPRKVKTNGETTADIGREQLLEGFDNGSNES